MTAHDHAHDHDHADGPVVFDRAFWEELYGARDAIWSGRPNAQLVTEATDLAPGRALDVGCGEGGDTLWLAGRGWRVTAVDISTTALQRAQAHVAAAGPELVARVEWRHADLVGQATSPPDALPEQAYDLVSAHFMHVPSAVRPAVYGRLAAAVAPGGTLLVVGHAPSDVHAHVGRWDNTDLLHSAAEIAALLAPERWEVAVDAARPRTQTDAEGVDRAVHDTVVRARRRS